MEFVLAEHEKLVKWVQQHTAQFAIPLPLALEVIKSEVYPKGYCNLELREEGIGPETRGFQDN